MTYPITLNRYRTVGTITNPNLRIVADAIAARLKSAACEHDNARRLRIVFVHGVGVYATSVHSGIVSQVESDAIVGTYLPGVSVRDICDDLIAWRDTHREAFAA